MSDKVSLFGELETEILNSGSFVSGLVLLSRCKDSQRKQFLENILHFCKANWRERIIEVIPDSYSRFYSGDVDYNSVVY